MKPPPFEYVDPRSVEDVVSALREADGEGKILAGGQSLMPLLNMRLARPELLIDLGPRLRRAGLHTRERRRTRHRRHDDEDERAALESGWCITSHCCTPPRSSSPIPRSATAAPSAAPWPKPTRQPSIRPSPWRSDAELKVAGPDGDAQRRGRGLLRHLPDHRPGRGRGADRGACSRACQSVRAGRCRRWRAGTATSPCPGAVTTVRLDDGGRIAGARVVLFGVGATPIRVRAAEDAVLGEAPGEGLFAAARHAAGVAQLEEPLSDVHASAEYRLHLA